MNSIYCESCDYNVTPQKNEDGGLDLFGEECASCDVLYCHSHYAQHECFGHDAEMVMCMNCAKEIWFKKDRPIMDQGDYFCISCITSQPWATRN